MLPGGLATAVMAHGLRPAAERQEAAGRRAHADLDRHAAPSCSRCGSSGISRRWPGEADARIALIIRGFGDWDCCSRRSTTRRSAASKPSEAQQASGLINLSRQLGGSFGIAVLGTYLTRHIAVSSRGSRDQHSTPATRRSSSGTRSGERTSCRRGSLLNAQQGAFALIDGALMKQATMLAYNDAWMFILLSFLCVAPAVFVLRKPQPMGPGGRALESPLGRPAVLAARGAVSSLSHHDDHPLRRRGTRCGRHCRHPRRHARARAATRRAPLLRRARLLARPARDRLRVRRRHLDGAGSRRGRAPARLRMRRTTTGRCTRRTDSQLAFMSTRNGGDEHLRAHARERRASPPDVRRRRRPARRVVARWQVALLLDRRPTTSRG